MYLFQGEFGCMLYTGDFRWERTSKKAQIGKTMLLNALRDVKIDNLYLDNTYCNPTFKFPPREVAAQQVQSRLCYAISFVLLCFIGATVADLYSLFVINSSSCSRCT